MKTVALHTKENVEVASLASFLKKTELWFSNESVQPVPEDPSEPLPYDRLANLRKVNYLKGILKY